MSEDPHQAGADWLTVVEAARVLNISERQARRYAARLPEHDRRDAGRGAGQHAGRVKAAQVRLSAMIEARNAATGAQATSTPDAAPDAMPDTLQAQAGHEAGQLEHRPDAAPDVLQQIEHRLARVEGAIVGGAIEKITAHFEQMTADMGKKLDAMPTPEQLRDVVAGAVEQGIAAAITKDSGEPTPATGDDVRRILDELQRLRDDNARLSGELGELREDREQKKGFFARLFGG